MIFVIGSTNPKKIEAVAEALRHYDDWRKAEVQIKKVRSGVAEQPRSLEEMEEGAANRARHSFSNCDYSIGLESGVWQSALDVKNGRLMESTICVIYDGKNFFKGYSSAFEVPKRMVPLILNDGCTISEAARITGITTNPTLGLEEGLVGILTNQVINRKQYMEQAVHMALVQLSHPLLYRA